MYLNPSQDGSELYRSVNTFVNYYNHRRKHSSLGYQTPASVYYGQSDEKWTQGMGNQSTCHRKDIACLHEGQGQALRVATEKIAEKAIFSVQTLTEVVGYIWTASQENINLLL